MSFYILNKQNEQVERLEDKSKAYKGIVFDSLKDAKNFKKYIYKKHHDSLGVVKYDKYVDLENKNITKKSNLVKMLKFNNFFKSDEWKLREQLNLQYEHYQKLWNMILVEYREKLQREVQSNTNNQSTGTSSSHLAKALYYGEYIKPYDTDSIKQYSEEFRKKVKPIDDFLQKLMFQYKDLHEKSKTKEKKVLLKHVQELRNVNRELEVLNVQNQYKVNKDRFALVTVKELKNFDIIRSGDNFNVYSLIKGEVGKMYYIADINGRVGCVGVSGILLQNDDFVIVDRWYKGEVAYQKNTFITYNDKEVNTVKRDVVEYYKKNDRFDYYFQR